MNEKPELRVKTASTNRPFFVRRMPASLRTPCMDPLLPAHSISAGKRRAMRKRVGSLSRYSKIFREDSGSRSSPLATRAIHSATSAGVIDPSRKPFQGEGSSRA